MNIEELLKLMVEKDASDIYITVGVTPAYRVEGKTEPIPGEALKPEDTERLAFSVISEKQKAAFLEEKEANLALFYPSLGRFRVNILSKRQYRSCNSSDKDGNSIPGRSGIALSIKGYFNDQKGACNSGGGNGVW